MKTFSRKVRLLVMTLAVALILPSFAGLEAFAATSKVKLSGETCPKEVKQGSSFILKGKITSNYTIKRVEVGVVYRDKNKWTAQKYDNSVNSKSFNLSKADPYIRFGKLKTGDYMYRIYAHTSDNKVHIVLNKRFKVVKKTAAAKTTKKTTTTKKKSSTKTTTKSKSTTSVKLSNYNKPGTYKVGKKFKTKGTISSNKKMSRVEVGIVVAATNKWTKYKYDKRISSKSFNLSKAASELRFDKLPGGTYRYRIYAHTPSGVKIVLNHKFVVKPSKKPQMAVNWAKKIAADDSFSYGEKPAASSVGCYFCGTNHGPVKYRKPKGYEKTYVCLTFLGAAYAHGAHDKEILSECKRGRMTMYGDDDDFKYFSCWMKIGTCRELSISDLQVGDVIADVDAHVWMYAGGDKFVDAEGFGWSKKSIAVRDGAESYLRWCGRDDRRNYVMRYIH